MQGPFPGWKALAGGWTPVQEMYLRLARAGAEHVKDQGELWFPPVSTVGTFVCCSVNPAKKDKAYGATQKKKSTRRSL